MLISVMRVILLAFVDAGVIGDAAIAVNGIHFLMVYLLMMYF